MASLPAKGPDMAICEAGVDVTEVSTMHAEYHKGISNAV